MNLSSRRDVELTGLRNVEVKTVDGTRYARQLGAFWLAVDEEDHGYTKHALSDGFWEAWITTWMAKNVKPGDKCIDVGANHGYYTFMLAALGCEVTALEPQKNLNELLKKSLAMNNMKQSVKILKKAASDKAGTVEMTIPNHHGMNATISKTYRPIAPDDCVTEKVSTTSLDSLRIDADFIKIDVEGAEQEVWRGMQKLWQRKRPLTLLEFRWDRYEAPEDFAKELFSKAKVSHVGFDGREVPLVESDLASRQHEDWMLVLR